MEPHHTYKRAGRHSSPALSHLPAHAPSARGGGIVKITHLGSLFLYDMSPKLPNFAPSIMIYNEKNRENCDQAVR